MSDSLRRLCALQSTRWQNVLETFGHRVVRGANVPETFVGERSNRICLLPLPAIRGPGDALGLDTISGLVAAVVPVNLSGPGAALGSMPYSIPSRVLVMRLYLCASLFQVRPSSLLLSLVLVRPLCLLQSAVMARP